MYEIGESGFFGTSQSNNFQSKGCRNNKIQIEKHDRFIPVRNATCENPPNLVQLDNKTFYNHGTQYEYQTKVYGALFNRENIYNKVMCFKKFAHRRNFYSDSLSVEYGRSNTKREVLHIPDSPERILAAPSLKNDYYINVMDWGGNDCIAVGLRNNVYIWNHRTRVKKEVENLPNNEDSISSVSWSNDSSQLAIGTDNSSIFIHDAETNKQIRTLKCHIGSIGCLSWNRDLLTSGGEDRLIITHDTRSNNNIVSILSSHRDKLCGLKWSPDGKKIASGSNDNMLNVWDSCMNKKPLYHLDNHTAAVRAISWAQWDRNLLASGGGSADRTIKLWDISTGICRASIDTQSQVCSLVWSTKTNDLVSAHGYVSNEISLWKYPRLTKLYELREHSLRVLSICIGPDGERVASLSADERLIIWKMFPSKIVHREPKTVIYGKLSLPPPIR